MKALTAIVAAAALLGAACSPSGRTAPEAIEMTEGVTEVSPPASSSPAETRSSSRKVDPRRDGFEIGFGEYAVTLEAPAIRPGPVTFVVHNGGKLVHGFEMEAEGPEYDSSGPGSGEDGFKIEQPAFEGGETIEVDLDLAEGLYKIECWVENHDDLGMEILLEVRPDAPKVAQRTGGDGDAVAISGFQFDPAELAVAPGTEVTWSNDDPEPHTVTADDGSFDSGTLDPGATFATVVEGDGSVTYFCAIHPSMRGTLTVG